MVYRASTCHSRFKSPKSFVTNSYVVSCRIELARFGSNPVYGNGGTSGSPDSALLHLSGAPRADDLLCKRNSCDCATCVATFFDKFCDSHTSELDTLCDKSRAPQNPPTSDHELARLQLPPLQRAFTSFQPPPQRGHYFLMMLFAQIWQSFAT